MAGGKKIYIGEMLEGMEAQLQKTAEAIASLEESNKAVVEEIKMVALNTSQSLTALKIGAGNENSMELVESEIIFTAAATGGTYNASTGYLVVNSATCKIFLDKFKSFADGVVTINILNDLKATFFRPNNYTACTYYLSYVLVDEDENIVGSKATETWTTTTADTVRTLEKGSFNASVEYGKSYSLYFYFVSTGGSTYSKNHGNFPANHANLSYNLVNLISEGAFVKV